MLAVARAISILAHPFVTMPIAIAIAARAGGLSERITGIVVLTFSLSVAIVGVYAIIGVRRGQFTNIDVSKREQRPKFYAVLIASTAACGALFVYLNMPAPVIRGTFVSASLMLASLVVNFWLKCSLHVAYTVFPLGLVWRVLPLGGQIAGVLFVLAMMWSRVKMKRHTVQETIAGAILGSLAAVALNVF